MKTIIGLGNPGRAYSGTRHNVGFSVIDRLSEELHIPVRRKANLSRVGTGVFNGEQIILVKPETFMNRSGVAVSAVVRTYHLAFEDILVICDDINLALGRIRIRPGGSAGGHNGLKSIIEHLGTTEFPRLRIGIGMNESDLVEHVLSRFNKEERKEINSAVNRAADAVKVIIKSGITQAMNEFNK